MMKGRTTEEQSALIQEIASIAHEVNAALCAAFGDDSQPPWNEAPKWQRNSCVSGVLFHIEHPFATPEDSHERWLQEKLADGWVYDEVKDEQAKTHPCCVPYYQLPPEQRAKDYVFKQIVHSLMHRSSTSYVQAVKEARSHE